MRKFVPPGGAQNLTPLGRSVPPPPGAAKPLGGLARPRAASAAGAKPVMSAQAFSAYGDAKEMLAVAEAEAERIRTEAERLRDEHVKQGYDEGYRKGYEEALSRLAKIEKDYEDLVARLEPQIVQLSVTVAEKILGEEMRLRPEAIIDVVGQALKTVRHQQEVVIRVPPDKQVILEAEKHKLLGILSRARELRIIADETLPPGGCRIETEVGSHDADVDTQLAALTRALNAV